MTDLRIMDRAELAVQRDRILLHLSKLAPEMMHLSPGQMLTKAERGEWQMWTAGDVDFVAATSVRQMADKTTRLIWEGCAGEHADWPVLARKVEAWSRRYGCERARLYGRRGWVRVLGYEPVAVIAERELP